MERSKFGSTDMKFVRCIRSYVFLTIMLLCLLTLSLSAQEPELDQILHQLKTSATGIESLQSSFIQEKSLEMFEQQLLSTGLMIYAQPDQLRWELLSPVASGFALQGEQGVRWSAVSGEVKRFSVDADPIMGVVAQQLLAWARVDIDWLEQGYDLEVIDIEPIILRLMPLEAAEAEFVDYIEVTFDSLQGHVSDVLVLEQSGDSTRLRFEDVRINEKVAAEAFAAPEF